MQEKPDGHIWAQLPQHPGHQLQLVILHPHRCTFRCGVGSSARKLLIHRAVTLPPLTVVLRRDNQVVVQRPQRGVGKPLVEVLEVIRVEFDGLEPDAVVGKRRERRIGLAGPADPAATVALQHGGKRRHEPTGGCHPLSVNPVNWQAVSYDNECVVPAHDSSSNFLAARGFLSGFLGGFLGCFLSRLLGSFLCGLLHRFLGCLLRSILG